MPNLQSFRDNHYEASKRVSQLVQTLSLSGLAVVWLFHSKDVSGIYNIPSALVFPLFLFVLCLFVDFAQHLSKTIIWHVIYLFFERKLEINRGGGGSEANVDEDSKLYVPNFVNYIPYYFFYLKSLLLSLAYFLLLHFVWGIVSFV